MRGTYLMICLFLQALILSAPFSVMAASGTPEKPQTASISLGAEYASGKYGTDSRIQSYYMPLIATWSPSELFDIGVELPFIYQSSSQVTTSLYTVSQGSATTNSAVSSATGAAAKGGPGGTSGGGQQTGNGSTGNGVSSDVAGLGDIILRMGVIALKESTAFPQIRPNLAVKCPTADTSLGLGTGEFDFSAGLELTKWIGDLHLTGEGVFTYQGRAQGFDLKNYISYTAGVGYQVTDYFEPMFVVKGATPPSSYSSELLEMRIRAIWMLSSTTSLDLYASKGLTDNSPDFGGGITIGYSF